jgi:large subunit ribosomal protein L6
MSRIGKKPVAVPGGIDVTVQKRTVTVKGPNGELSWQHHPRVQVGFDGDAREINVSRAGDDRESRALHGLTRSLINNMVTGVQKPFEKRLEIQGVGYNATLMNGVLNLAVGYANTVQLRVPQGVKCELPTQTLIVITSPDKQKCGQFAAEIRAVRPPEPYKGKGIRYQGEFVRRKAGKAFAGGK